MNPAFGITKRDFFISAGFEKTPDRDSDELPSEQEVRNQLEEQIDNWRGEHVRPVDRMRIKTLLTYSVMGNELELSQKNGLSCDQISAMPVSVWTAMYRLPKRYGISIDCISFPKKMRGVPEAVWTFSDIRYLKLPDFDGSRMNLRAMPSNSCGIELNLSGSGSLQSIHLKEFADVNITVCPNSLTAYFYDEEGLVVTSESWGPFPFTASGLQRGDAQAGSEGGRIAEVQRHGPQARSVEPAGQPDKPGKAGVPALNAAPPALPPRSMLVKKQAAAPSLVSANPCDVNMSSADLFPAQDSVFENAAPAGLPAHHAPVLATIVPVVVDCQTLVIEKISVADVVPNLTETVKLSEHLFNALESGQEELVDSITRMILLLDEPVKTKCAFLNNGRLAGVPGLALALKHGHVKAMKTFVDLVLQSALPEIFKVYVLQARCEEEHGLTQALNADKPLAIKEFIRLILNSDLPIKYKVRLVEARKQGSKKMPLLAQAVDQHQLHIIGAILDAVLLSSIHDDLKLVLTEAKFGEGRTAFSLAFEKGSRMMISTFFNKVQESPLSLNSKFFLCEGKGADGMTGIDAVLSKGDTETVREWFDLLTKSRFAPTQRFQLFGKYGFGMALAKGHLETVKIFGRYVLLESFSRVQQTDLLRSMTSEGPGLELAISKGHQETIGAFIEIISLSSFDQATILELLCAKFIRQCRHSTTWVKNYHLLCKLVRASGLSEPIKNAVFKD